MAIKGMDISYWQGNVDFARVAADGIKFAILREGYAQTVDAKFRQYVDGCRKNGIEIKGVYHFSYALNAEPRAWRTVTARIRRKATQWNKHPLGLFYCLNGADLEAKEKAGAMITPAER